MFCNFKYCKIKWDLSISIEFLSSKNMRCLITRIVDNFIPIASHRPMRYLRVYARRLSIIPLTNSGLYAVDENASAFKTVASANTIKIRVNKGGENLIPFMNTKIQSFTSNNVHILLHIIFISLIFDILIINQNFD